MQAFYWLVRRHGGCGRYGGTWTHLVAEAVIAAALILTGLGISRFAGAPLPVIGGPRAILASNAARAATTASALPTSPGATSPHPAADVRAEIISGATGRAVLVVSGRQAVLVDGGPPDVGLAVVSRLRSLGIARLSAALLTDPRAGAALGLVAVLDAIPVGRILDLAPGSSCAAHAAVLADARAHATPVQPAQRGTSVAIGPAQVQVLWPASDLTQPGALPTGPGLVRLVDGSVHVLLAGGIDPGQLPAIQRLGSDLGAQVLELPAQSGTGWTSDLLRLVSPRVAILEPPLAGSEDTTALQRLAAARVVTLEATAHADLQLQTDGHGLILSFDPGLPGHPASPAASTPAPAPGSGSACA